MSGIKSAKTAHADFGLPRRLYFDKRGEKGIFPVDRRKFKGPFELFGDMEANAEWSSYMKGRQSSEKLEEGVWFDFGPILSGTVSNRRTTFGKARTHPDKPKELIQYAQARMIWKGQDYWVTVSIQAGSGAKGRHVDSWFRDHVVIWLEGPTGWPPEDPSGSIKWEGEVFGHYQRHATTTPHEILPYALGWAEKVLFPTPSERMAVAIKNTGKPKGPSTLTAARSEYTQLGNRLARRKGVKWKEREKGKMEDGRDRKRVLTHQTYFTNGTKAERTQWKARRRELEKEFGSAVRVTSRKKAAYDAKKAAREKKKARGNPSSWYLGGQKQGLRGMQYYYFNRHRPYILHLSVREPKASGKLNKVHVWVKRAHPGKSQETRIRLGELTEKEWWESLDPQRPTRWRGGSLTLDPIEGKRFYFKGHLTSLKYQALDWADSVIFTPSERLGLL